MTTSSTGRRHPISDTAHVSPEPPQYDSANTALRAHSPLGQAHIIAPPSSNLLLPRGELVGRDHEIVAIQQLLLEEQIGLLTLTGPGGIGKTRLSLHVAANVLDHFVDGVYFVSLAPISDAGLVIPTIAQTLGIREAAGRSYQEGLQDSLRDRQLLLVLDNFEHVLTAAPFVGALVAGCPRLKILVTSRATLHLYGEQEFPVPPLALPDARRVAALETGLAPGLAQVAAVALFIQRAREVQPEYALTATNAEAIANICIGLDGLPLAIELAAAKVKLFTAPALLARLQQRLTLLTDGPHDLPARQRTLRAEIGWSYDLLTAGEQALFRRLAVFVGGFTLEAAQAVAAATAELGIELLEGVASLVAQSLLRQIPGADNEARFDMLETIREYALDRLAAAGEVATTRRRHADYFLVLAEEADLNLRGPQQPMGLQQLETNNANLHAALVWSLGDAGQVESGDHERGLRLAGALCWFWHLRTRYNEARKWCDRALALCDAADEGRARALQGAGVAAQMQGDFAYARRRLEESLALWRILGDRWGIAYCLGWLAWVEIVGGDPVVGKPLAEASLVLFREMGDNWGIMFALDALGPVLINLDDYATARAMLEECLSLARALGDLYHTADALAQLGDVAFREGDYETAHIWIEKVEGVFAVPSLVDDKFFRTDALHTRGLIARQQGDGESAAEYFAQCLILAREADLQWFAALAYQGLGFLALQSGDDASAMVHFRASLALSPALGKRENVVTLSGCVGVAAQQGQSEAAAKLCAAVDALLVGMDRRLRSLQQIDYVNATAAVRARRHEARIAAAWAEGQALSLEEAIRLALTLVSVQVPAASSIVAKAELRPELQFFGLGPARVQRGDHPIASSEWTYVKARELLFYLLCHPPRTREQIGVVFWPDASPTKLRNSFGVALHHLRRALGRPEWIVFEGDRYSFNRALPYWFDLEAFEGHLSQARQGQMQATDATISHLEQAIALSQGEFLEDFTVGDWTIARREQAHRQVMEALLTLGRLLFSAGEYDRAAHVYQQAIARDRTIESAHYEMIRCYARLGERGQALRHYQRLVEFMRDELGLPPDAETTALVERLRLGEAI